MTAQNRKIRWGVLGCARIASQQVLPALERCDNSEFYAIASRDPAKLAQCRSRFNVPQTYPDYEALLRDPQVDAVYIPLPNSLHCEWTLRAAEHGKHVLCEKPLALNAAEARRMAAACAANGVNLMEAFMYRYTERTRKVIEVVRSGALGEIRFLSSTFRFLLTNPASIKLHPELGGGALYDVGCYPLNFVGLVLDAASPGHLSNLPESVSVQCVRSGGVDTLFSALMKYPSGAVAAVHCGFNAQKRVFSEIIGTEGLLEIPDTFLDEAGELILTTGTEQRRIPVPRSDRYRSELEDFADSILRNRPPALGLAESERNMAVLDRLLAASRRES
jgi:D-xylose 1-dehydrogenase (NADP+, D-xylono-1,5-lactone-forming)